MKRTVLSLLLFLCLLAGLLLPAFAAEENPATRDPKTYTTSVEGIAFIADFHGSNPKGTSALKSAEAAVNAFIKRDTLDLTQAQFDALVDFVMDKGTNMFTQGYKIEKVISSGTYTDVELADAFFSWVKGGVGEFSEKLFNRRMREVKLFLYGSYSGSCNADFRYIIYDANGGKLDDNTVLCYENGSVFADLPTATRGGYFFAGWYTKAEGGEHLCSGYSCSGSYHVYAHWSKTAVEQPNEPAEGETQTDFGTNADTTIRSDVGAGVKTYPNHTGWPKLSALKVSEAGVEFIKQNAGFSSSTGYGFYAGAPISVSNPITLDQADYVLRYNIAAYEKTVDKALDEGTVLHTQSEYDAILSLTCALGPQWMQKSYQIYQFILHGGYSELSFVNTVGSWVSSNGTIQPQLCPRRMEEADLYLNGDYAVNNAPYRCLIFNGNGGTAGDNIEYYEANATLDLLPTATKTGSTFAGWYTEKEGGTQYSVLSLAPDAFVTTLYAHWAAGAEACTHTNTLTVHRDASCVDKGYDREICVNCNKLLSDTAIPALGHDLQEHAAKHATCTEVGWEAYKSCSRCEYTTCKLIGALGHEYVDHKAQAPTCTEVGWEAYQTCKRCEYTSREDIPALGHDYVDHEGKPATCTEDGWVAYQTCKRCDFTSYADLPALGHDYKDGICTHCGDIAPDHVCPSKAYRDVDVTQWYHASVDYVLNKSLMNGTDTDLFEPNGNLTRAMLVTILYRLEKTPNVIGDPNPFTDVPEDEWYTDAVIWAAREGIVNGMTEDTFAPDENITREQIATIFHRYAGSPAPTGDLSTFPDINLVSDYALTAMQWAVGEGIINGNEGLLDPLSFASRAQIAAILYRYLEN